MRWFTLALVIFIAAIVGCGGGQESQVDEDTSGGQESQVDEDTKGYCLEALTAYVEAQGLDTVDMIEELADEGVLSFENIEALAELSVAITEEMVALVGADCLTEPQAALNVLCTGTSTGYHDDLWIEEWCGPTAVPARIPEAMPTPEAAGPALEILNTSSRTDSIDYFHVVGEVMNNSDSYVILVKVEGSFFNAAGDLVASEITFALPELVAPGELAPFEMLVMDGGRLGIADFQLQVQGTETSLHTPVPGLSVQVETTNVDFQGFHVVGRVINESVESYSRVLIFGTFYDANGTVVATGLASTVVDVLPAGLSSPFDLLVLEGDTLGITSHKLTVRGSPIN